MAKKSYGRDVDGKVLDTQLKVVKAYLMEKPGVHRVTHRFCEEKWGFTRLSDIIFRMKKQLVGTGYEINDRKLDVMNRWGNITHPKEYWIEKV